MATAEIKSRIYSVIEAMPLEKLDAVAAFLEDLQRSSEDETALLLGDASFMRDYREAKDDIRSGSTVNLKAIRCVSQEKLDKMDSAKQETKCQPF